MFESSARHLRTLAVLSLLLALGACGSLNMGTMTAHECMTRVMYFESNRSSPDGMLAVGTVVMNRAESGRYPDSVCGVVGQRNQFAPGVLTRSMGRGRELASRMATKVLRGARHPNVGEAKFFHTAGMTFPYTNMHYLVEAGGNVFYEKRANARRIDDPPFQNRAPYEPPIRSAGMRLVHVVDDAPEQRAPLAAPRRPACRPGSPRGCPSRRRLPPNARCRSRT